MRKIRPKVIRHNRRIKHVECIANRVRNALRLVDDAGKDEILDRMDRLFRAVAAWKSITSSGELTVNRALARWKR